MNRIKELDGLRGIAIIIIIISHFENSFLTNGGVNIFFVLTGFLITKIIYSKGLNFNIFEFYLLRLNKLYPQLLLSLFLIFLIYLIIGEFDKNLIFLDSLTSSISSTMNIYLIGEKNDYNNQSFINPLLPLWAFSIIIQFYLLYPILLKSLFKFDKYFKFNEFKLFNIFLIFTVILYISYLYLLFNKNDLGNFYSFFARFWQFILGGSVYFFIKVYKIKYNSFFIFLGSLLLILWQLPNVYLNHISSTFIISLATVLIIIGLFNKKTDDVFLFSSSPLISMGKISYPIYIWHMPLIYFSSLYFDQYTVIIITLIFGIFIALGIHEINYKLFYKIKDNIKKKNILFFSLTLVFIFFSLFVKSNLNVSKVILSKLSSFQNKYNYYKKLNEKFNNKYPNFARSIITDKNGKKCQRYSLLNEFDCRFNIDGKNGEVILLGTSALAAFSNSLTSRLIKNDYSVSIITAPGCPYVLGFHHYNRKSCNEEYMKKIQNYLNSTKKPATVIYFTRYALYINGKLKHEKGFELNLPILMSKSRKHISLGFKDTFIDILGQGHKLLLIYPLPEINKHVPKEYQKKIYKNNFNLVIPYKNYVARTENIFKLFDSIQHKNLYRFFPDKYLCKSDNNCITKINNKILYTDHDHLGINGSEFLSPLILKSQIFKVN